MFVIIATYASTSTIIAGTWSLSSSLETVINKLSGIVDPLIIAEPISASDMPRCFKTDTDVDFVHVAVRPRKQRTPNLSRRTCN